MGIIDNLVDGFVRFNKPVNVALCWRAGFVKRCNQRGIKFIAGEIEGEPRHRHQKFYPIEAAERGG